MQKEEWDGFPSTPIIFHCHHMKLGSDSGNAGKKQWCDINHWFVFQSTEVLSLVDEDHRADNEDTCPLSLSPILM